MSLALKKKTYRLTSDIDICWFRAGVVWICCALILISAVRALFPLRSSQGFFPIILSVCLSLSLSLSLSPPLLLISLNNQYWHQLYCCAVSSLLWEITGHCSLLGNESFIHVHLYSCIFFIHPISHCLDSNELWKLLCTAQDLISSGAGYCYYCSYCT